MLAYGKGGYNGKKGSFASFFAVSLSCSRIRDAIYYVDYIIRRVIFDLSQNIYCAISIDNLLI